MLPFLIGLFNYFEHAYIVCLNAFDFWFYLQYWLLRDLGLNWSRIKNVFSLLQCNFILTLAVEISLVEVIPMYANFSN